MTTRLDGRPEERVLTGWGRTTRSRARVVGSLDGEALAELMAAQPPRGILARGAGRSYGDAAQNAGGIVVAPDAAPRIEPDLRAGTVRASAGSTFADLLSALVPHGLLLPVLPGTRHLTLGGAIAADVHGKNHHVDGSISSWLESIELIDGQGRARILSPLLDGPAFRATVGGMGLTGIIRAATVRLMPISSSRLQVSTHRVDHLDDLMAGLHQATQRYAVAWIDATAQGRALGRGVLDLGDHLDAPDPLHEPDGLHYRPTQPPAAPPLPFNPATALTARAFNTLWYRKAPRHTHRTASLNDFFHRLDAVAHWNRALGPRGFLQYQFAVPEDSAHLIAHVLQTFQNHRTAAFLATVKRFGPANGNPLSFPLRGWCLAVDMPAAAPGLGPLLDQLDRKIAEAGGQVYLAKDARLSASRFTDMYGDLKDWRTVRDELDPRHLMRSDLGRRLGLCR
ncbi:FAD-binding oxidoreductase [Streptacidiphilus carbonis]|uniref:FAD-binding oxidoreductase n=1 Tax=Streptacidiphilus carbonis TaxID=105422 RepID=UPI0005A60F0B|nr:FAD-binding oxidoreductase [Streptacidiphilus carbonis]